MSEYCDKCGEHIGFHDNIVHLKINDDMEFRWTICDLCREKLFDKGRKMIKQMGGE